MQKLVEFKSKVTGYNGYEEAANLFTKALLNTGWQNVSLMDI